MSVSNTLTNFARALALSATFAAPAQADDKLRGPTLELLQHSLYGKAMLVTLQEKHPEIFAPNFNINTVDVSSELIEVMKGLALKACSESKGDLVDCFVRSGTEAFKRASLNALSEEERESLDNSTLLQKWVALQKAGLTLSMQPK